jgi:hypothetical protein
MNARTLTVLLAGGLLAAWAAAQHPTGGLAHERLELLKANRPLLEDLLGHGLSLGDKNSALDRARESRETTNRLARELRSAVYAEDADRIAEMTDLYNRVWKEAFAPNLCEARDTIPPHSEAYKQVREMHRRAAKDVADLAAGIPAGGPVGTLARVKTARTQLEAAAADLGPEPADPGPAPGDDAK